VPPLFLVLPESDSLLIPCLEELHPGVHEVRKRDSPTPVSPLALFLLLHDELRLSSISLERARVTPTSWPPIRAFFFFFLVWFMTDGGYFAGVPWGRS